MLADSDITVPLDSSSVAGLWRVMRNGTLIDGTASAGARQDASVSANPTVQASFVRRENPTGTDAYAIQIASRRVDDVISVDDTTLVFMALKAS